MSVEPDPQSFRPFARRDGWSPARKVAFLDELAQHGNVRAAARAVRISAQAADVERRCDELFAATWDAALVLAAEQAEQVYASFALEGIEEDVWYRGEKVGTRKRFDTRLMLAHLARLDKRAASPKAQVRAGRFEEMLALVAGLEFDHAMVDRGAERRRADEFLPVPREEFVQRAYDHAYAEEEARMDSEEPFCADAACEGGDNKAPSASELLDARIDRIEEHAIAESDKARQTWDLWHCGAIDTVDEALDDFGWILRRRAYRERTVRTVSTASTSAEISGDPGQVASTADLA